MTTHKLVLLLVLTPLLSLYAATDTSEATVKAYFAALAKGDRTNANYLTARFRRFGDAHVAAVTDRDIELHKRPEIYRQACYRATCIAIVPPSAHIDAANGSVTLGQLCAKVLFSKTLA